MTVLAILLGLLALGAAALLLRGIAQNRALWQRLRAAGRPLRGALWRALRRWSPLGLMVLVLAVAANRLAAGAVALAYEITGLDAYCRAEGAGFELVLPCTGLDRDLPRRAIVPAPLREDLEAWTSERFRIARLALLDQGADRLRTASANRVAFERGLSAMQVLGLEPAPESDPELQQYKRELRALLGAPVAPAASLLDRLRHAQQQEARTQRLRQLTSRLRARRAELTEAAYGGQPRAEQARRFLRHRLSHALADAPPRLDPVAAAALARLGEDRTAEAADTDAVRRGALALLARGEAQANAVFGAELARPDGVGASRIALDPPRRCVLAGGDGTPVPCLEASGADLRLRPLGFKRSVRRSLDRWHEEALEASVRRLGALGRAGEAGARRARAAGEVVAGAVPAGLRLGRADCGWWRPAGCAANAAVDALEEGVDRAFGQARREAGLGAAALAEEAAANLDQRIGAELLDLDLRLDTLRSSTRTELARLFLLGDLLRLLGWLALALVVMKSYLHVLALELFQADTELRAGFESAAPVEGAYASGRRLTIDPAFTRPLLTRRQLSNADHRLRLAPWPRWAVLARLLRGRYFLYTRGLPLADGDAAAHGRVASAPGGLAVVEWRLREGEEVVFRVQDFFGSSDNVALRSELSLRLTTLLFGRLWFRVARCGAGEGRLLLRADVEEVDQARLRALPPERLIAWSRHAQFTVHSPRGAWRTLLDGYTLVRAERRDGPSGLVLVSSEEGGASLGTLRFLRRIASALF